jgi:hypothetical protein
MIRDALGMVGVYAPRDALEAALVIQIVVFHYRAQQAMALAAMHEDDVAKQLRSERHAMALQRGAALLERRMWQHRRALAAEGEVRVSPPAWEYDLDALEAAWREAVPSAQAGTDDTAGGAEADARQAAEQPDAAPATAPRMLSRQQRRALARQERHLVAKLAAEARRLAQAA